MDAYIPGAWKTGAFGIREPDPVQSEYVPPEEIDLVLCPGTVFDEQGNRLGMGSGYYDRFLTGCTRARVFGAAFACQIVENIPKNEWDHPMDKVFTEQQVIAPSK